MQYGIYCTGGAFDTPTKRDTNGVINNVPPNEQCTLFVTDGDAVYFINTSAAVTIKGIIMPTAITYINTETHST